MISFELNSSLRLGKSLEINNISSHKVCSFSCRYCQHGLTDKYSTMRKSYFAPNVIFSEVHKYLKNLKQDEKPDYLTFVANGEPTLDSNLGETIALLKQFNIPIAVKTNASLLKYESVRKDLLLANRVSLKVDAGNKAIWETINWPMSWLSFDDHIAGIIQFSESFHGQLVTETTLVKGVNDSREIMEQTSLLISKINPVTAYLSVPRSVSAIPSDECVVNEIFQVFSEANINTELLLGLGEINTGYNKAIDAIINVCAERPILEDFLLENMRKNNLDSAILTKLTHDQYIKRVEYGSNAFYIRSFHS